MANCIIYVGGAGSSDELPTVRLRGKTKSNVFSGKFTKQYTTVLAGIRQYSKAVPEHIPVHQLAKNTCTSYNHYPIPAGPWQEHYNKQQSRWNRNLAFAAGLLCATIVAVRQSLVYIV